MTLLYLNRYFKCILLKIFLYCFTTKSVTETCIVLHTYSFLTQKDSQSKKPGKTGQGQEKMLCRVNRGSCFPFAKYEGRTTFFPQLAGVFSSFSQSQLSHDIPRATIQRHSSMQTDLTNEANLWPNVSGTVTLLEPRITADWKPTERRRMLGKSCDILLAGREGGRHALMCIKRLCCKKGTQCPWISYSLQDYPRLLLLLLEMPPKLHSRCY